MPRLDPAKILDTQIGDLHGGTSDDVQTPQLAPAIGCGDGLPLIAGIMARESYADHRTGIDRGAFRLLGTADGRFGATISVRLPNFAFDPEVG